MKYSKCHYWLFLALVITFLSCSRENTTNPDDSLSYSLSGVVYGESIYSYGIEYVTVTLLGNGFERSVISSRDGKFAFESLDAGQYILKVKKKNITIKPDSLIIHLPETRQTIQHFWGMSDESYERNKQSGFSMICGKVITISGLPVSSVELNSQNSSHQGFFQLTGFIGKPITLTPRKEHYSFSPDSLVFTPDEPIEIIDDFIANYSGPPVFTISGRVLVEGEPLRNVIVDLKHNGKNIDQYWMRDLSGSYRFTELPSGEYTLIFKGGDCAFNPDSLSVTVDERDVTVQDVNGIYRGATWYDFTGRVVDRAGRPVHRAKIHITSTDPRAVWCNTPLYSDPDGLFGETECLRAMNGTVITFMPEHEQCSFDTDSITVTLEWKERTPYGGIITIPDFIATDYRTFTPADYFPLSAYSPWTYSRTVNLLPAADHTITASGTLTHDGQSYRKLSPTGPAGFTAYRVEGNNVYTLLDNAAVELLRFGVIPGTTWVIGKSGGYPLKGTFIGLETVTVPAGTFPDCLRFQVRKEYGATTHETYTLWFAKGVGMVRSEKVLFNYGVEKERVVDELK